MDKNKNLVLVVISSDYCERIMDIVSTLFGLLKSKGITCVLYIEMNECLDSNNIEADYIIRTSQEREEAERLADVICCSDELQCYIYTILGKNAIHIIDNMSTNIIVETILEEKDFIWITAAREYSDRLFKLDKINYEIVKEFRVLQSVDKNQDRRFIDIVSCDNKIFMIPDYSEALCFLDKGIGKINKIPIDNVKEKVVFKSKVERKFCKGFAYKDKLFMIPQGFPTITKYVVSCNKIEYLFNAMSCLEGKKYDENLEFCKQIYKKENHLFFYSRAYKLFLDFDMEKEELLVVDDFTNEELFDVTVGDGDIIYLFPRNILVAGFITKYDIKNKTRKKEQIIMPQVQNRRIPFQWGVRIDKYIVLLPGLVEEAVWWDYTNNSTGFCAPPIKCNSNDENWKYRFVENGENNCAITFNNQTNELVVINAKAEIEYKKVLHENYCGMAEYIRSFIDNI